MPEIELPPDLVADRDALVREIYDVFGEVTREGGIGWYEAEALSFEETADDLAKAREMDAESSWQELVGAPHWETSYGYPAWSFLDPIGFRYYLPLGMMQSIRSLSDEGICFHLTLPDRYLRDFSLNKWSALDEAQSRCVSSFLRFMARVAAFREWELEESDWVKAYQSHWAHLDA